MLNLTGDFLSAKDKGQGITFALAVCQHAGMEEPHDVYSWLYRENPTYKQLEEYGWGYVREAIEHDEPLRYQEMRVL